MSTYIKRRLRFPDEVVHKRNTDRMGLGLNALCGVRGDTSDKGVRISTNTSHVTCPTCKELVAARQARARERVAGL